MTEAEFRAYIEAFNADDYDGFRRFYADDVVVGLGGDIEIRGADAVIAFFREIKGRTRRTVVVNRLVVGQGGIAAELESEFLALEDQDLYGRPMKAGETFRHVTFALYETEGGRFTRIRSARYSAG